MTANPYAIPVEDLVSTAHVPLSDQVEERAEPHPVVVDRPGALYPFGDAAGDADGD